MEAQLLGKIACHILWSSNNSKAAEDGDDIQHHNKINSLGHKQLEPTDTMQIDLASWVPSQRGRVESTMNPHGV